MQPKTYLIRLCRPFSVESAIPYIFYLHAETKEAALEWLARVFTGIDVETTRRRWTEPRPAIPRVGCTDPVSLQDCDNFRSRKRVNGQFVTQPVVPGEFRRSAHEVADGLYKIFMNLQEERSRMMRTFEHFTTCYARDGRPWQYERLREMKAGISRALVWQENLWLEYLRTQQSLSFELPVERELAAA